MKKTFYVVIAVALLLNFKIAVAQVIPNAGFENWQAITSYFRPVSWQTSDTVIVNAGGTANVNKETVDIHGGLAAAKLETGTTSLGLKVPGVIVTGNIIQQGITVVFGGGFTWSTRSQKLSIFYKYVSGGGIDSGLVSVILFRRNGSVRDTIAVGKKSVGTQSSYTAMDVNLVYQDFSNYPDSALIIIQSSKNLLAAQSGTSMLVDDVSFSGSVPAGIKSIYSSTINISVFPNPATENVHFAISNINSAKTLNIFDILGKKIKTVEITSAQLSVSTDGMNNSLYFYQVADRNNNVISTGKFSVKK